MLPANNREFKNYNHSADNNIGFLGGLMKTFHFVKISDLHSLILVRNKTQNK